MQQDKIVVGLDIGTTKICALVGRKNEYGKLEIMGMGTSVSDGVQRGIVLNIDKTVEAIKRAIRQAEEQYNRREQQKHARVLRQPGDLGCERLLQTLGQGQR